MPYTDFEKNLTKLKLDFFYAFCVAYIPYKILAILINNPNNFFFFPYICHIELILVFSFFVFNRPGGAPPPPQKKAKTKALIFFFILVETYVIEELIYQKYIT